MRYLLRMFFAVLLASSTFLSAADPLVVYGDDSYPPYSYMDPTTKKPAGVYVEILKAAFAKMPEYKVEIAVVPWKRGLSLVETGEGCALFPPYYNTSRESWMNMSEPILEEKVVVFGLEEKLKGKNKWPEDFYGSRIGLNAGFHPLSMGGQPLVDALKSGKMTLDDGGKSNEVCLEKLVLGRIDFYLNDRLISLKSAPTVKRSNVTVMVNNAYLGFTKKTERFPNLMEFKTKFDTIIKDMKKTGAIDAIVKKMVPQ